MKAKAKFVERLVSADVLGVWLDLSVPAISGLARRGVVVRVGRGKYDLQASIHGYCQHLRGQAAGRGGEKAVVGLATERARLAREQADGVAMKNKAMRGELVEASAVEAEWSDMLRTVRAGMLAVPSRCAQRLPHLTAHDVGEIDREVREVLAEEGQRRER